MIMKPSTCESCVGWKWFPKGWGFVPPSGSGENGVLLVGESAGEHEQKEGMGFVGKAGSFLFSNLQRAGVGREGFRIANVISCRPPDNKLAKMAYEVEAIAHCAPFLDTVITDMQETCRKSGRHLTIVTLGRIAFKRVMGFDDRSPEMKGNYLCYPFWSDKYKAHVIACDHPSYLMRGNNHLIPVLQFGVKRALEIAEFGLAPFTPNYLCDPGVSTFATWVDDYEKELKADPGSTYLSFDIETPHKQGKDEEKAAREDDDDYTILRCSFAYKPGEAVSVVWNAEYKPLLEHLFNLNGAKVGWNSDNYDLPRIRVQMGVKGDSHDAMNMWHMLNSALPKGLGFVTPFYVPNAPIWKHLSNAQPAYYNACDADMALRIFLGVKRDLVGNKQWEVYERHIVDLNRVLAYMSGKGVLRDEVMRQESEVKLQGLLDSVESRMEASIPKEVRKFKVYKKVPKSLEGLEQISQKAEVKRCSICKLLNPKKAHFKETSLKNRKLGLDNVCEDAKVEKKVEEVLLWAKPLPFKLSKVGLSGYQKSLKHQAVVNRREHKVTFDEMAIKQLVLKYPKDPLYPLILEHREYVKLLGTYIGTTLESGMIRGGMPVGRDGHIHAQYTHNPSTLRLACQSPNMMNLPRAKRQEDLQTIVRNLIVAAPGCKLVELDFGAIEAVLVGWFAGSADYIRLAKLGIHSFLASYVLGRPADLKWSDSDLKEYFKEIKKSKDQHVQDIYNSAKRTTHLSGYGGTPKKMHMSEPDAFPTVKDAEKLQGLYFEVCPYIKKWHLQTQLQAEKDGFLTNPYLYIHRFLRVFTYVKECGKWVRKPGDDQNKVLAFLPQSTAAGIIKEAMLRLYYERFEEVGQYLRLQVHDSLVCEVPEEKVEQVIAVMKEEMTKPIPVLPMPTSYNLGPYLSIDVDSKKGEKWGSMNG